MSIAVSIAAFLLLYARSHLTAEDAVKLKKQSVMESVQFCVAFL